MKTVIRYTKFPNNPGGDGGCRRSAQIEEYWKGLQVNFIDEKFILPKKYSINQAIKWFFQAIVFITCYVGWKKYPQLKDKYRAIFTYALRLPVIYDKYKEQDIIFLWENTHDVPALYLMKAAGAKIIGYPHNLESLVPTQVDTLSHKKAPYWLYEEIERLKLCDEVYCISKEETWLLQLYGINAKYFPYYPPEVVEQELLNIKERRNAIQSQDNRNYLILGSATNPPTRIGMQKLIDYFGAKKDLEYTIHIAGYQTDSLEMMDRIHIINHGTVSVEVLNKLLIETDGIIIYQPTTSGALTRIVENRIAGIPIYANFGAARDFYNLADVHIYETLEDLNKLL